MFDPRRGRPIYLILNVALLAVVGTWGCSPVAETDADADAATVADTATATVADTATATVVDTATATVADTAAVTDTAIDAATDVTPTTTTAWGPITGACGAIAAEIDSLKPSLLINDWQFNVTFDSSLLSSGARKRYDGPNAGGSSICSEVFSMQLLAECSGATVYKTETEIRYDKQGSITDWEADIGGKKVGVSVTRAYKGPQNMQYGPADAVTLLKKKLAGVNESSANVRAADKWTKQVLHVWTLQPTWVPILEGAWQGLSAELKADTVVLITVEKNSEFVVADTCD